MEGAPLDCSRLPEVLAFLESCADNQVEMSARDRRALVRACDRVVNPNKLVVVGATTPAERKEALRKMHELARRAHVLRGECQQGEMAEEEAMLALSEEQDALAEGFPAFFLHCYVCKIAFKTDPMHETYTAMCSTCGEMNRAKRDVRCPLIRGRVALVTGARIKIGFEIALKLLRDGCTVLATTRFAADCKRRFEAQCDAEEWSNRLRILEYDFCAMENVEKMCAEILATVPALDFIIHNAAQTIRRPEEYYAHLRNQPVLDERFPVGLFDRFGEQVDLSERNSWGLLLGEVSVPELQEAMQINACAPFVITSRLRPLMERVYRPDKHIVFVSAMEGAFYRKNKTARHPHTNMAKAALNMIVRTSAQEFAKYGIHMNCVDTGWVTNEAAAPLAQAMAERGFTNPLDCVDGAARVLDPIFSGMLQGCHRHGFFFKDYFPRLF